MLSKFAEFGRDCSPTRAASLHVQERPPVGCVSLGLRSIEEAARLVRASGFKAGSARRVIQVNPNSVALPSLLPQGFSGGPRLMGWGLEVGFGFSEIGGVNPGDTMRSFLEWDSEPGHGMLDFKVSPPTSFGRQSRAGLGLDLPALGLPGPCVKGTWPL